MSSMQLFKSLCFCLFVCYAISYVMSMHNESNGTIILSKKGLNKIIPA